MSKKSSETKLKYGNTAVCRADFDALIELDKTRAKLDMRLELAIKTLSDQPADSQDKNIILLQQFIDTTYKNSKKGIEEKQQAILSKYPVKSIEKIRPCIRPVLICISIIITLSLLFLSSDTPATSENVYLSRNSKKYHIDYYCSSLTGTDKSKPAVTKKIARTENYLPCANCCR